METDRLRLEPWHERHRPPFRAMCADSEVMRYVGAGDTWDEQEADERFDAALKHWRDHGFGWRAALDSSSRAWLGLIALNYVAPGTSGLPAEAVEIGWWVVPPAWGRGYASEGAAAVRDEAFQRVGLQRIVARLHPANVASARVAEKIGMRFECEATGRFAERLHIYSLER
jgi:RimJ/RimL family protein N-acetyltransferase